VACLAFIEESFRVQADVGIVAIDIIQPYGVVHDLPRLITAYLAEPTVDSQPMVYISLPGFLPCLAFIKLFLGQ
jgi:hypothetical protein